MSEELDGTQQLAAALHGSATNGFYPLNERLKMAVQAREIYEAETEALRKTLERFKRAVRDFEPIVVERDAMLLVIEAAHAAVAYKGSPLTALHNLRLALTGATGKEML